MWDVQKFKDTVNEVASRKVLGDEELKNKEALYRLLGEKLFVSYDTVKGWTRKDSAGPGDIEIRKKLEVLLGTSFDKKKFNEDEKEIEMKAYSDFVKTNIYKAYELVLEHMRGNNIESEESYLDMYTQLSALRVGIPQKIYEKIIGFVEENLDPIIYNVNAK